MAELSTPTKLKSVKCYACPISSNGYMYRNLDEAKVNKWGHAIRVHPLPPCQVELTFLTYGMLVK